MMLLQKGHVTTAAQRVQRAMDGNLYAPGVSAVRFCDGVKNSIVSPKCAHMRKNLTVAHRRLCATIALFLSSSQVSCSYERF